MKRLAFDLIRVEFWSWWEHRRSEWLAIMGYRRRTRAESDVVHRYGQNIYGDPMFCGGCGDKRYHP